MEVHNISIDDNEADTSGDEWAGEEEYDQLLTQFQGSKTAGTQEGNDKASDDNQTTSRSTFLPSSYDASRFRGWERPPGVSESFFYSSSGLYEEPDPFHFYLLDTVSSVSRVKREGMQLDSSIDRVPVHNVYRLFGVTTIPPEKGGDDDEEDHSWIFDDDDYSLHDRTKSISVCCNVHGFLPYFYALPVPIKNEDHPNPSNVEESEVTSNDNGFSWTPEQLSTFHTLLNRKVVKKVSDDPRASTDLLDFVSDCGQCIARVEAVKYSDLSGVYHFFERSKDENTILLKVFCTLPSFVWTASSILSSEQYHNWKFESYESNINSTIHFLTDRLIKGCCWYEVKGGSYFVRGDTGIGPKKETACQIELDVHYENIFELPASHNRYIFIPAIRVLSFDIEVLTSGEESDVPRNGRNQVLQISGIIGNYYAGAEAHTSIVGKTVFVLGTCGPIPDVEVVQFYPKEDESVANSMSSEAEMMAAWRDFVVQMDPDIITGYNIKKFDVPYLLDRCLVLTGFNHNLAGALPYMGRIHKVKSQVRNIQNHLKKAHRYDTSNVNIQGRLMLDFFPIIVRHEGPGKKGHYTLSNVAKRLLGKEENKLDVHYSEIKDLQNGDSTTRNRLARYCLQDAVIPYLLLFIPIPRRSERVTYLEYYCNKSRLGGTPLRYLINKSPSYSEYFKQVQLQKNPGRAIYIPDSPQKQPPYPLTKNKGTSTNSNTILPNEGGADALNLSMTMKRKYDDENNVK